MSIIADRALPEAGIATPVDFAAPGAGIKGAAPDGTLVSASRNIFCSAARRGASAGPLPCRERFNKIEPAVNGLVREARDLGKKGADKIYGNGLLCEKLRASLMLFHIFYRVRWINSQSGIVLLPDGDNIIVP